MSMSTASSCLLFSMWICTGLADQASEKGLSSTNALEITSDAGNNRMMRKDSPTLSDLMTASIERGLESGQSEDEIVNGFSPDRQELVRDFIQGRAVAIGSHGHAIAIGTSLHSVPVQVHSLAEGTPSAGATVPGAAAMLDKHPVVRKRVPCEPCTLNVQITTLNSTILLHGYSADRKTLQVQACVEKARPEDGLWFSGCTTSGEAAGLCLSQSAQGGVRVLMDRSHKVVGYGSCCAVELVDRISQVSVVHCGAMPVREENVIMGTRDQMNAGAKVADAIVSGAKQLETPAGVADNASTIGLVDNRTYGGIWDAWPENATDVDRGFTLLPRRLEIILLLVICATVSLAATAIATALMIQHLRVGKESTGGFFKLHTSSVTVIGMLWPVPLFACMGFVGLLLPELSVVWQFLEALLLSATLRKMPELFVLAAGGELQMQLSQRSQGEAEPESVDLYTQWPLCGLRWFLPAKVPKASDIRPLQWIVAILCLMLPVLSFTELFFSLEVVVGPPATQSYFASVAPAAVTTIRLVEACCLALGLSAIGGLEMLASSFSPKAEEQLAFQSIYCQTFLGGLRLLPMLCSLAPLWGLGPLREGHGAAAARGAIISIASLFCALVGWRAFPADEDHYPPSKPSRGPAPVSSTGESAEDVATTEEEIFKPVLDQVKYCPFCGFSELQLEANSLSDGAACPRCCAHNVPLRLVVRRGSNAATASMASGVNLHEDSSQHEDDAKSSDY